MPIFALVGPLAAIIDKIIPDKAARDKAKLELLQLQGSQDLENIRVHLSAIVAEETSPDPWTSRARPSFLYVMYEMIPWALPMGLYSGLSAHRRASDRHWNDGLPQRPARPALCAVWHRVPRLHRRPPVGQIRGDRQVTGLGGRLVGIG